MSDAPPSRALARRTTTELQLDAATQRHVFSQLMADRAEVVLPPLPTGRHMFGPATLGKEEPPGQTWDSASFRSVNAWLVVFTDVLVHSDAGIIAAGGAVVADTLQQTSPERHGYAITEDGIALPEREVEHLVGTWISLLGGNYENYYHWTLDGLGRFAPLPAEVMAIYGNMLVPPLAPGYQQDSFAMSGLGEGRRLHSVARDQTFHIERLVVPWSITGYHTPHPSIAPFFARFRPAAAEDLPRRIYIDRRAGDRAPNAHRCLVNDDEVVAGLARLGFVPVRLETLPFAAQAALFAGADFIVAPHGAGLANLVYARPGTMLVELHMDGWVNWCFRNLAATLGITYDAVLGRELNVERPPGVTTRFWSTSVMHLLAAIQSALDRPRVE